MKKLILIYVINIFALIYLSGCNKEDSNIQNSQNSVQSTIKGNWIIDKVQLQHPPSTTTTSAFMKASLSALGLVATSTVGEGVVSFGSIKWEYSNNNVFSDLQKIKFIDDKTGWIVYTPQGSFDKGILKTTDGGLYWNKSHHSIVGYFIYDLSFANANTGFAIASEDLNYRKGIYKTSNGGYSWEFKSFIYYGFFDILPLSSIIFLNEQTGWVIGNRDYSVELYKTTDGGSNWFPRMPPGYGNYGYLNFYNSNFGVATGINWNSEGIISKTIDGGNTWNNISITGTSVVKSIQFLDEQNGFTVCNDNNSNSFLFKTNDGGASWVKLQCIKGATSLFFQNSQTGYVTGNSSIAKTTNAGKSWFIESSGTDRNLNGIIFLKSGQGIAIGNQGTILRQTNNIDEFSWSLSGYITNPLIKSITNSTDEIYTASGTYYANSSNEIYFDLSSYSGGLGKVKSTNCMYLLNSYLNLTFNLTDNEKWLVILRR